MVGFLLGISTFVENSIGFLLLGSWEKIFFERWLGSDGGTRMLLGWLSPTFRWIDEAKYPILGGSYFPHRLKNTKIKSNLGFLPILKNPPNWRSPKSPLKTGAF